MSPKKVFEGLLYLSLLTGALIFVWHTILEFLEGETSFSVRQELITLGDLPSLTICLPIVKRLVYGQDFVIDVKVFENEENTIQLVENQSVKTLFDIDFHLREFQPGNNSYTKCNEWAVPNQCYMITSKWIGKHLVDFTKFGVQLLLKFSNETNPNYMANLLTQVIVASEENSYGLALGRWFDGKVDCLNTLRNGASLRIVEVNEFVNLETMCSQSYYQCLAKRFALYDFSTTLNRSFNGSNCHFDHLCTPVTLPFEGDDIPLCDTEQDINCYGQVLTELTANQNEYCRKACHVEEYKVEHAVGGMYSKYDILPWDRDSWSHWLRENWEWGQRIPQNSFLFEYDFELPLGTRDRRSNKPFKTVKREFLIITGLSLVGNIGGTLGMFAGFSLFGISDWFITISQNFLAWIKHQAKDV